MKHEPLIIDNIKNAQTTSGRYKVSAIIEGEEVWFESDLELVSSPEAFLSAFILAAMESGRVLQTSYAVDPVWRANMESIQDIFHKWWGYKKTVIDAPLATSIATASERKAVLFSAGVDSFYGLLRYPGQVDAALFVEGLDIMSDHDDYRVFIREHVRRIATERGKMFCNVCTNLREHTLFNKIGLDRTHGAALAACAHVLTRHLGHLIVNSNSTLEYDVPLGTHWDTDPLWSSSALSVEHWGQHIWRADKLIDMIHYPVVQKNLRVCNIKLPVGTLNCGKCEKCIRTMIPLHQHNQLQNFETLQPPVSLFRSISRLRKVKQISLFVYDGYLANERDPKIRRAIRGLLRRDRWPAKKLRSSFRKRYWRFMDWLENK